MYVKEYIRETSIPINFTYTRTRARIESLERLRDALNARYFVGVDRLSSILSSRFTSPFRPLSVVKLFRQSGPWQFSEWSYNCLPRLEDFPSVREKRVARRNILAPFPILYARVHAIFSVE